jgi:hypothetical protein
MPLPLRTRKFITTVGRAFASEARMARAEAWLKQQVFSAYQGAAGSMSVDVSLQYGWNATGWMYGVHALNSPPAATARYTPISLASPIASGDVRFVAGTIYLTLASNGTNCSPVVVDSPTSFDILYAGAVSGRIVGVSTASGLYTVKLYNQVPGDTFYLLQTVAVSTTGTWSLTATAQTAGWRRIMRLFDGAGVQVGGDWTTTRNGGVNTDYTAEYRNFTDTWYHQTYGPVYLVGGQAMCDLEMAGTTGDPRLRIINTSTGVQQGNEWFNLANNKNYYTALVNELVLVSDIGYDQSAWPVFTDGTWAVYVPFTAARRYEIRNGTTLLAVASHDRGMIRSYLIDDPADPQYNKSVTDRCWAYDQALAIVWWVERGDIERAYRMCLGFLAAQYLTADKYYGSFPWSVNHLSAVAPDQYIRSGGTAWFVYAMLRTIQAAPTHASRATVETGIRRGLGFFVGIQSATLGLVGLGYGRYVARVTGNPNDPYATTFDPTWDGTTNFGVEHNIDLWYTFRLAKLVLGDASFQTTANQIRDGLNTYLYDSVTRHTFYLGCDATGAPYAESGVIQGSLDSSTWGALWLISQGDTTRAGQALDRANALYRIVHPIGGIGYTPYSNVEYSIAVADPRPLWIEGSMGATLAQARLGRQAEFDTVTANVFALQETDGSYRYSIGGDAANEIPKWKYVGSTVWALFNLHYVVQRTFGVATPVGPWTE